MGMMRLSLDTSRFHERLSAFRRGAGATPILQHGFRPFFLAAGLSALALMALWIAILAGYVAMPGGFDPIAWHGHEMIFGYGAATVTGFLLTAIPNWTGRLPVRGAALGALALLWLAGRIAVFASPPVLAAAVDLAFLLTFLVFVAREIVAGRNWRNLPVCVAVGVLLAANALMHAETLGLAETSALGRRLGAAVLLALIALIGGRIVPSFTGNWLKRRGDARLPAGFDRLDRACLAAIVAALLAWTCAPEAPLTAALAGLGALGAAVRLARWRGLATLSEPLLWALHLGYGWLAAGLALLAAGPALGLPPTAAWHALFVGAIGTMTLAVMTRATLGHTGRALHADRTTTAAYLLVGAAAALRIAAAVSDGDPLTLLTASALAWMAAFGLFALRYGPMLLAPRRTAR